MVITLAAIACSMVIQPDARDAFRSPKDLALAAAAIIISALTAGAWLLGMVSLKRIPWKAPETALVAASLLWVGVTTLTSTNRVLSAESALRFGALLALILATIYVGLARRIALVWAFLAPALLNAVLMMSQAAGLWSPFPIAGGRISVVGMLGNPDDAAGYLVAPAILAAALTMALPRHRLLFATVTITLVGGIWASQTITAGVALAIALPMVVIVSRPVRAGRVAALTLASVVVCFGLLVVMQPRLRAAAGAIRNSGFQALGASRTLPFFSALEMAADHPLTGVGPGCFGYQYMPYQLKAQGDMPRLAESMTRGINFAEAHNDHLQILAECGLPGYALFAAALLLLARCSGGEQGTTPASEAARIMALPLAAGIAILCAGHFALQLASSASVIAQTAALCVAWRHRG